ncbi:MAG: hypothetical protein KAV87_05885 [Desulfobacteraceae bacterium]|nr:hypothetical protein [Desulfobacteraceae bacterium]
MEPVVEKIAVWIEEEIDGVQDPGATLTLRAVRPKILDWEASDFKHGDVIIELVEGATLSKTTSSRTEAAEWKLYGIIRTLPADTAADTVLSRMAETIRRILLSGNKGGQACGGLAQNIDCPETTYSIMSGGVVAEVTAHIRYVTDLADGYKT